MKTSQNGLEFIKSHEGFKLAAYQDVAGKWTIGVGHLIDLDTEQHLLGAPITEAQVIELLQEDVREAEAAVNSQVTATLNQNQFDALVSFVFNLGSGNFSQATFRKLINQGKGREEVEPAWKRWDKARDPNTGQLVSFAGLARRRQEEVDLYYSMDPKKKDADSSGINYGPGHNYPTDQI